MVILFLGEPPTPSVIEIESRLEKLRGELNTYFMIVFRIVVKMEGRY